jgi:hypothetical protein
VKVRIAVRLDPDARDYDVERWTAESAFPHVVCTSQSRTPCVDFVVGAVLCALGNFRVPPRLVEFEVVG